MDNAKRLTYRVGTLFLLFTLSCSRLKQAEQAAHFSILDSETACGETGYRTMEIELLAFKTGERAMIQVNGNGARWDTIEALLHDVYLTRVEKFIYFRVAPGVSSSDESEMFHLIERAGIERLCILDSKTPHKYAKQLIPSAP
jgi:hypothetical protein